MKKVTTTIAILSALLCSIIFALMFFRVCDWCSCVNSAGVDNNIPCCLLTLIYIMCLGIIGLAVALILKIIIWVKQLRQSMSKVATKITKPSLLLCGIGIALMLFRAGDRCSCMVSTGRVYDNIFCMLGPLFMGFLGIIGLVAALILKIIIWIKQLHQRKGVKFLHR